MSLTGGSKFILTGGANYQIARSLRFRSSASAYLTRTYSAAPTTKTKCTISAWVKLCAFGTSRVLFDCYDGSSGNQTIFRFNTSDQLEFDIGGASALPIVTTAVFRDPSAWLHIVCVLDTTLGSSRVKFWVNGASQAVTGTGPGSSAAHQLTSANANNKVGSTYNGNGNYFDGYMAEFHFIDGQALTPSSFGQTDSTTGAWNPIKYIGTYGTNGFYLPFSDNSAATSTTIGKDSSGNGNNWTPSGISVTADATNDSLVDTPTNYGSDTGAGGEVRGNYCTLNPLDKNSGAGAVDGNLTSTASGSWQNIKGSIGVMSGKWFWEVKITAAAQPRIGVATSKASMATFGGIDANQWCYYYDNATYGITTNGTGGANAYGTTFTTGDLITVFLDADNGKLYFAKGATLLSSGNLTAGTGFAVDGSSNPLTGLSGAGPYFPYFSHYTTGYSYTANFGQRAFDSSSSTIRATASALGFKALCTQNLPAPAIVKPSSYFDVALKTGTGSAVDFPQAVISPDLYFLKDRSGISNWQIGDTSRTNGNNLHSNSAAADVSNPSAYFSGTTIGMQPYDADGGTNAHNYVGYQWKKGALPGFDVVTWTGNGSAGQTVAHALGVTPKFVVMKKRNAASTGWVTYHASVTTPTDNYLILESSAAPAAAASYLSPSSSLLTFTNSYPGTNASGDTYVGYLFAEVAGFSKFGSYTGNGSTDGPFVWCGFRPRFFMFKRIDTANDWEIIDTARDTYNMALEQVAPNSSGAASSGVTPFLDIVSNGIKIRGYVNANNLNASGGTYIFAAFAEAPFKTARAR